MNLFKKITLFVLSSIYLSSFAYCLSSNEIAEILRDFINHMAPFNTNATISNGKKISEANYLLRNAIQSATKTSTLSPTLDGLINKYLDAINIISIAQRKLPGDIYLNENGNILFAASLGKNLSDDMLINFFIAKNIPVKNKPMIRYHLEAGETREFFINSQPKKYVRTELLTAISNLISSFNELFSYVAPESSDSINDLITKSTSDSDTILFAKALAIKMQYWTPALKEILSRAT